MGVQRRGTRRGKKRWLWSPPSFVQNTQQDGKESCRRQLGARCPYDLMWKEDSKDHDQSREEPQASECERLPRGWAEACSHNFGAKRKPFLLCSVHATRGHRTSRIQLCLFLLTHVIPLAMKSKSQPSHCGFVEFLSILRTVSSPVPSGPLDAGSGTPFPQPV